VKGGAHNPLRVALLACVWMLGAGCAMPVGKLAERPWHEVVTPHFHLLSDASATETARMAEELARFHQLLTALEVIEDVETRVPVTIVAIKDKYEYGWLTNRQFISGQAGITVVPLRIVTVSDWHTSKFDQRTNRPLIAGWYVDGLRGGYAVAGTDVRYRGLEVARGMLFNVYAHFVLSYGSDSRRPLWFEDGYAEYLSGFEVDESGGVTVGTRLDHRVDELRPLSHGEWEVYFYKMEDRFNFTFYPSYFQPLTWATTHYLMSTPERRAQLREYLRLYDAVSKRRTRNAYYRAFGASSGELRQEVHEYYRRNEYPSRSLGPEALGPAMSFESRRVAPGDLLFHLGDVSANGARHLFSYNPSTQHRAGDLSAERLFEQSLEHDPGNGRSLAGLAAIRLRGGGLREAEELLQRAEALAPDAEWVHTLRGNLLLARARESANAERAAQLEAARAAYRRAIEDRSAVPEPYFRMAQTYLLDDPASEEAIEWLHAARELSPKLPQVMLELAAVKLERGDTQDVRALLDQVLAIEGDSGPRDRARRLRFKLWRLERGA
jgi:tetratricopeptide (TPR) repeat protein